MPGPVDLTPVNPRITTVEAPQSSVSAGQIAAPYRQLSEALDKGGEAFGAIAETAAEEAGRNAVTKDADGNLQVQRQPIIGPASNAFARATRFTYLAKAQPEFESHLTALRLKFPNDPTGFKTAADAFQTETLGKISDPALRGAVEKVLGDNIGQNQRSLMVQADHTNVQNALVSLQSRLSSINEQGASLARQGGTDTQEYARVHADRQAIYGELTKDARFNYPKERADFELATNRDADVVQSVVGNVVRTYQTRRNQAEAQQALQNAFWGPGSENLKLTAQKRDAGVAEGLKALQRVTAEETVEMAQNRHAVGEYVKNVMAAPATFDDVTHNTMVAKARAIGDYKSVYDLDAARVMQPTWLAIGGLTDNQRVAVQQQLTHGIVPAIPVNLSEGQRGVASKIEAEAKRQGVDASVAKSIGYLESSFDPARVPINKKTGEPLSSARGVFQMTKETRDAAKLTDDATPEQQIAAGVGVIKANVEGLRAALGRDPTPTEIYTAHYQGLAGAKVLLSANPNADLKGALDQVKPGWGDKVLAANPWMQGMRTVGDYLTWVDARTRSAVAGFGGDGTFATPAGVSAGLRPGQPIANVSNPYVQSLFWNTVAEQRRLLSTNSDKMASDIEDTLINKRQAVGPDELRTFALAASVSGNDAPILKVERALATFDKYQGLADGAASPSVAALRDQLRTVAASGTDPVARHMLNNLDTMLQGGEDAMKKNPLKEGAVRGWVQPIRPLSVENPDASAAELLERQKKILTMQSRDATLGPMSAVGAEEAQGVKTALTQGPVEQAAGLLNSLSTSLSADNFKETMATEPMREALTAMSRSNDPVRMGLGMSTLDRLWRASPEEFKARYGEGALTRLQAWQGLKDSFSPQEVAERMNRADDPAMAKARGDIADAVEKSELPGYKPAEVAYQLGTGWPGIGRLTGSTPSVPYDGVQAQQLAVQFGSVYKALRVYGVEPDMARKLAVKRLQSEWAPSPIAGGQLMQYPPEKYYKQVDGGHDWMQRDLQDWLARKMPLSEDQKQAMLAAGGTDAPIHIVKGLMSDAQTQAEIAQGKPPSYRVAVADPDGLVNILPERIAWDRSPHVAKAEREFTITDQRSKFLRANTGPVGGMFGSAW